MYTICTKGVFLYLHSKSMLCFKNHDNRSFPLNGHSMNHECFCPICPIKTGKSPATSGRTITSSSLGLGWCSREELAATSPCSRGWLMAATYRFGIMVSCFLFNIYLLLLPSPMYGYSSLMNLLNLRILCQS